MINSRAQNFDLCAAAALILLIVFGVFGFTGFVISCFLLLAILFSSNKSTAGVFLIWIFFDVSGLWSDIFGIPKGGLISVMAALVCFYMVRFNHSINYSKSLSYFVPIFLLFGLFYFLGPMHSYSTEKLIFIIYKGIFYLIAFLILLLNPSINFFKIALLITVSAFQYYCFVVIKTDWSGINSIADFGALRRFYAENNLGQEGRVVNYQEIGLLASIGFAFILNLLPSKETLRRNDLFFFLISLLSVLLILYSGSRQSLFSIPILFGTFLLFKKGLKRKIKFRYFFMSVFGVLIFTSTVLNHEENNLGFSKGDTLIEKLNRPEEMMHAFNLIEEKPLMGHGLGGFTPFYDNARYYPHNIFLELLSEIGLIGTFFLIVYLFVLWKRKRAFLNNISNSGFLIIPVFLALFIRANLSSDLIETIFVISFLIAWSMIPHFQNYSRVNEDY